jgi:small-conductance mechanosensitive channel
VEEISKLDFIDKEHGVRVVLREFGDSSVNLKLLVWVPVLTQYVNDCEILECVYNTLNRNGIQIPFPQRDLHIVEDVRSIEVK